MYRETGYNGDGAYGYQCLECKERVEVVGGIDHWKLCPCCGKPWVKREARLPSVPRWAYDRWGNDVPYGTVLWPNQKQPSFEIVAEYKIKGHDDWNCISRNSICVLQSGNQSYMKYILERFDAECHDRNPFPVEYRIRVGHKVVISKEAGPME